jgi:hypothetical protein
VVRNAARTVDHIRVARISRRDFAVRRSRNAMNFPQLQQVRRNGK